MTSAEPPFCDLFGNCRFTGTNITEVTSLPSFKAIIQKKGKITAVSVKMSGSDILVTADTVKVIDLRKLVSKSEVLKYTRIEDAEKAADGTFIVLNAKGKIASGKIDKAAVYQIVMFIQDNGKFDIDKTDCAIIDPTVLVKAEKKSGGSGGGGCNAGFGTLALLCATLMMFRRKQ